VPRRLSWLLALLAVSALGCGDSLIGNTYYDGGLEQDGGVVVHDAGQDAASAGDAGDAQVDAIAEHALIQASQALGVPARWLSRATPVTPAATVLLLFTPVEGTAKGTFILYCPEGCPFKEFSSLASGRPATDVYMGNYALYHLTDTGTVLGVLFNEDGRSTADLQFAWSDRPSVAAPIDEVFISFGARLGFLPDSTRRN
jgi:hypothetical protein